MWIDYRNSMRYSFYPTPAFICLGSRLPAAPQSPRENLKTSGPADTFKGLKVVMPWSKIVSTMHVAQWIHRLVLVWHWISGFMIGRIVIPTFPVYLIYTSDDSAAILFLRTDIQQHEFICGSPMSELTFNNMNLFVVPPCQNWHSTTWIYLWFPHVRTDIQQHEFICGSPMSELTFNNMNLFVVPPCQNWHSTTWIYLWFPHGSESQDAPNLQSEPFMVRL